MAEIKIGCGPFLPSRQKYMEQFGCVEVSDAWFDPIPPKTRAKWQAKTPKGFDYLHVAWGWLGRDPLDAKEAPPFKFPKNDFGLMQPTDANRTVWQHVDAQARALGATTVLLKTPPTFAPSENNRANMATFVREIIGEVPYGIAWEPRGFWEVEETAALAKELDIVVVRDVYGEFEMPEPPTEGDASTHTPLRSGRCSVEMTASATRPRSPRSSRKSAASPKRAAGWLAGLCASGGPGGRVSRAHRER
jgi:uncharacterized protein YecE (DUF72 family)